MKRILIIGVLILALVTVSVACATPTPAPTPTPTPAPTPADGEEIFQWTFINTTNPGTMPILVKVQQAIEEGTGGRIKLNMLHYGMHPYKPADTLDVMRDRAGEIGFEFNVLLGGVEPLLYAIELPFLLTSQDELNTLLDDPKYASLLDKTFAGILAKYNAFPLSTVGNVQVAISADVFIDGWDSLEGKQIRTYGVYLPKLVEMLGGEPVAMPFGEVYEAIHRGIVDGWCGGFASCVGLGFYEVGGKKVTLTQSSPEMNYIWMNNDAFNELPEDLQGILLEVGRQLSAEVRDDMYETCGRALYDGVNKYDMEFRGIPSAFRAELRDAFRPIWDSYAADAGPGAAEIVEALDTFHEEYLKTR